MRFIDSKNRLFGRFPLALLFVLLGLVFLGLVAAQTLLTKPDFVVVRIKGSPGNWWWVTPRPPDWLAASIQAGNKEYNALGQPTAEVLAINTYDAGGPTKDVFLTVKLSARKNRQTQKYRYKGESLEVGSPIALTLDKTFFPGLVTELYSSDEYSAQTLEELTVDVKLYDKWPWEFDAIRVGETMTDGAGSIIAEIVDKQKFPAEKETVDNNGRIIREFSPVKSDFFLTVKLRVRRVNNDIVFREEQYVKVGNALWMQFPSFNVSSGHIFAIHEQFPQ